MKLIQYIMFVLFLSSQSILAIVDNNNNGMSDVWERKYQVIGANPSADLDGDNQNNLAESLAGTDPNNAQSVLYVSQIENIPTALFVSWQSKEGIKYQIKNTDDIIGVSWQNVGGVVTGNGTEITCAFDAPFQDRKFYRIDVIDNLSALARGALADMTRDTDGDGQSDVLEIRAGSNPFDAQSVIQPPIVKFGSGINITWPSILGKLYKLKSRLSGSNDPWVYVSSYYNGTGSDIVATIVNGNTTDQEFSVECSDVDNDDDNLTDWEELAVGLNPQMAKSETLGDDDAVKLAAQMTATNMFSIKLSGAVANITRMENGGFEIIREAGVDELSIQYIVTGNAVGGADYAVLSGSVTIPFGQKSVILPVVPLAGSTVSLSKAVIVSLQDTQDYDLGAQTSQQVNIIKEVALDVSNYGAVGDGVTDDTASVQAAFDALGSSSLHNTLHFPSGVYRLNTAVLDNHYGVYKERILTFGQQDLAGRDIVISSDGNAALYSTVSPVRSDILVVWGTFRTLQFYSMKWEKDSAPLARLAGSEPNGADGVSLARYDGRYLESLNFYSCDFINCHGAIKTYLSPYIDQGKMKNVGFYDCNILNPYGANTIDSSAAWGGGQQCNLGSWVGEAVYLRNTFEGGGEDLTDQATSPGGHLKDGSHFGSPGHLIFQHNTVLRMGVEAVYQQSINNGLGSTTESFVMPAVNDTTDDFIAVLGDIGNFSIGQIVNIRTPLTPTLEGGSNLFEIVDIAVATNSISLKNIGYASNWPEGAEIIANLGLFLQDDRPTTALITDNFIDGEIPPGGVAFDAQSGIAAAARVVIKNNVVRNFWTGVMLYDEVKRPLYPTGRGSVINGNYIESRDTHAFGGFSSGIQISGGNEYVTDNYVITPHSTRFRGIVARKNDSIIYMNYVGAETIVVDSRYSANRSVGIGAAHTSTGVIMSGNITRGFDVGAGRVFWYQDVNYTIEGFMSFIDQIPTDPQSIWN